MAEFVEGDFFFAFAEFAFGFVLGGFAQAGGGGVGGEAPFLADFGVFNGFLEFFVGAPVYAGAVAGGAVEFEDGGFHEEGFAGFAGEVEVFGCRGTPGCNLFFGDEFVVRVELPTEVAFNNPAGFKAGAGGDGHGDVREGTGNALLGEEAGFPDGLREGFGEFNLGGEGDAVGGLGLFECDQADAFVPFGDFNEFVFPVFGVDHVAGKELFFNDFFEDFGGDGNRFLQPDGADEDFPFLGFEFIFGLHHFQRVGHCDCGKEKAGCG